MLHDASIIMPKSASFLDSNKNIHNHAVRGNRKLYLNNKISLDG